MLNTIILVGICLLGIVAGHLLALIRLVNSPVGTLRIDQSDPDDSPYFFLELDDPIAVNKIAKSDKVSFRVRAENYIS